MGFVVLCVHFGTFTVPFSNRSVTCISSQGLFYSCFFACILVPSRFPLVTGASPVSVRKDFFTRVLLHGFWLLHGSPTIVGASPASVRKDLFKGLSVPLQFPLVTGASPVAAHKDR